MRLSILTATYNRSNYIQRIYNSIKENLKLIDWEIEWVIIDDGSTDNTKEKIYTWIIEAENIDKLNIKYIYQKNSGKMHAINKGMSQVTGNLIVDCDSDDYFSENAFLIIEKNASKLFKDKELYALCFLKENTNKMISGNTFNKNFFKTTMFDLYFKEDIEGEKILVFNTRIRKEFKHELEKNENFVTEARMYHKMDKKYKILCINESIEIGDYIKDGYTKNIIQIFKKNPNGYYKYFKEILQMGLKGVALKKKIYVIKHFLWFKFLIKKPNMKNNILG